MGRKEVDLRGRQQRLHVGAGRPIDQLSRRRAVLVALDEADAFRRRTDPLFRERDLHVVALLLGEQRVDDEENAATRLPKADRHRSAAAALGIGLNVLPQLLHVGEAGLLVAIVDLQDREDSRHRGARSARVGHLQHALVGRIEQVVPRRRWLQIMLLQEFGVGHEHQGIVGDPGPHALRAPEALRQIGRTGRRVGLEDSLLLAGRECLDRSAEQHIDLRIASFREQPRQRFAGGKADEINADTARLLERFQHRARIVFRPDRIGLQALRGMRAADDKGSCDRTEDNAAAVDR